MKIGLQEINKIINDCKKTGFDVKMNDIAYVILVDNFKDKSIPYKILFDKDTPENEIDKYNNSKNIKFLKKYISTNVLEKIDISKTKKKDSKYADLTFEENKDAMIKMISELKQKYDEKQLEYKDYAKMVADLRIKLNDKFSVTEKQDNQHIIVYKKYNDICMCGREIYRPTKEDIIEDLRKEYKLIPKSKIDNGGENYE